MKVKKENLVDKELQYYEYIQDHIKNVQDVWNYYKRYIPQGLDVNIKQVDQLIKNHDADKFEQEIFHPYRQRFFRYQNQLLTIQRDIAFDSAWKKHYMNNKHHWESCYMPLRNSAQDCYPMELKYMIEMLCDWGAMSVQCDNDPREWYYDNYRIKLHSESKEFIEYELLKMNMIVNFIRIDRNQTNWFIDKNKEYYLEQFDMRHIAGIDKYNESIKDLNNSYYPYMPTYQDTVSLQDIYKFINYVIDKHFDEIKHKYVFCYNDIYLMLERFYPMYGKVYNGDVWKRYKDGVWLKKTTQEILKIDEIVDSIGRLK